MASSSAIRKADAARAIHSNRNKPQTLSRKGSFPEWAELQGQPCLDLELHADPKKGITVSRSFGKRITEYPEIDIGNSAKMECAKEENPWEK
jgi:hypothetical protein